METIKFSKSSFWFKYWDFIKFHPNPWNYPEDTCSLRRDILLFSALALFSLPYFLVLLILMVIKKSLEDDVDSAVYIILTGLSFISTFIGLIHVSEKGSFWTAYLWSIPGVILGLAAGWFMLCLIFWIVERIGSYRRRSKEHRIELNLPDPMITTLWRDLKDKVCSKIEYVD